MKLDKLDSLISAIKYFENAFPYFNDRKFYGVSNREKNRQIFKRNYNLTCLMAIKKMLANERMTFSKEEKRMFNTCLCSTIQTMSDYVDIDSSVIDSQTFKTLVIKKCEGIENINNKSADELGLGKLKIISKIRNGLAHNQFFLEVSDDNKVNLNIKNGNHFECQIEYDEFVSIWSTVFNNLFTKDIVELIKEVEKTGVIDNAAQETVDKILLNLLFNNNKEHYLDDYKKDEYFTVDTSDFKTNWFEAKKSNVLINKLGNYEIHFIDDESERIIKNEYSRFCNILLYKKNPHKLKYIFDVNKTAFDLQNQVHIPNTIFLSKLRNAVAHGNYYPEKGNYVFYDDHKEKLKFTAVIERDKMIDFLLNDVFLEPLTKFENELGRFKDTHIGKTERLVLAEDIEKVMVNILNNAIEYTYKLHPENNDSFTLNDREREAFSHILSLNGGQAIYWLWDNPKLVPKFLEYNFRGKNLLDQIIINHQFANTNYFDVLYKYNKPLVCMNKNEAYDLIKWSINDFVLYEMDFENAEELFDKIIHDQETLRKALVPLMTVWDIGVNINAHKYEISSEIISSDMCRVKIKCGDKEYEEIGTLSEGYFVHDYIREESYYAREMLAEFEEFFEEFIDDEEKSNIEIKRQNEVISPEKKEEMDDSMIYFTTMVVDRAANKWGDRVRLSDLDILNVLALLNDRYDVVEKVTKYVRDCNRDCLKELLDELNIGKSEEDLSNIDVNKTSK